MAEVCEGNKVSPSSGQSAKFGNKGLSLTVGMATNKVSNKQQLLVLH